MSQTFSIKKLLGDNIRRLRTKDAITQEAFAEKINLTPVALSKIENGISWPKSSTIDKIVKELNIEPFMLFIESQKTIKEYRNIMIEQFTEIVDKNISEATSTFDFHH